MKKLIFLSIILSVNYLSVYAQFPQIYSQEICEITAIATDVNNNVYVTGPNNGGDPKVITIKYDQNGNIYSGWPKTYNIYNEVIPKAIVVDGSGNVYVTGAQFNGNNYDIFTIKYDMNGVQQPNWPQIYDGQFGDDQATGISLDNQGNIYLTGYSMQNHRYGNNYDMVTIAYHPDGTKIWTNLPNGISLFDLDYPLLSEGHGDDYANGIATYTGNVPGTSPAVFICGQSWLSTSYGNAYITVQLNLSDGTLYWYSLYRLYSYSGTEDAAALAIAVSQQTAAVYTTGYKSKENSLSLDCITMQNHWGLYKGNPYCLGGKGHECEDWCGSYVDERQALCYPYYGNPDYGEDRGKSISIIDASPENNIQIFVTGFTHTAYDPIIGYHQANGSDYLILKYNGTVGQPCNPEIYPPINVHTYDGTGQYDDGAKSICTDVNGNVYVTGYTGTGPGFWRDVATIKLDNSLNNRIWLDTYDGPYYHTRDEGVQVKSSPNYVYVGGYTNKPVGLVFTPINFITFQYNINTDNPNLSSVSKKPDSELPKSYWLQQNYPNPFNPITLINFDIPRQSSVTLKIYDVLGHEVSVLIDNEIKAAGRYNATFNASNLASGVYYYKLIAGDFMDIKKMVLMK